MGNGWVYQDSTGTLVVHPTRRRRTRYKKRRSTTGARRKGPHGNRARSSREQWCDRLRRKVANGQINSAQAVYAAKDKYGNYQKACADPNHRKLLAALEKARTRSPTPLIDEVLRKQKAASSAAGSDLNRLRNAKSASQAWQIIKKGCQIAVKQLEEARRQGASDPNITVWNSRTAKKLHAFLGEANKWTERGVKAINLYQAFVAFRQVDPKKAATDPKTYAAQMGSLLRAVGNAMKGLPEPFDTYGEFLGNCGDLFTNMRCGLDPRLRRTSKPYLKYLPK